MAQVSKAERVARMMRGGNTMNHAWQRYLAVGVLGAALLLGLAAGLVARRATTPAAAVPAAQGVAVPVDPPGASDPAYRLSAPNEQDPQDSSSGGAVPANRPAYRLSPPNESDPTAVAAPVPGFTDYREDHRLAEPTGTRLSGPRLQQRLYANEVRDTGQGTTSGDSGLCREPGRSCDR